MNKKELMEKAVILGIPGRSIMTKDALQKAVDEHVAKMTGSISALAETLATAKKDHSFANGTVIRWVQAKIYTYAAIKTPVGWFTTARSLNLYVAQTLSFDGLLKVLKQEDVCDVEIAVKWEVVG